jgi:spermidine synthase
LKPQVLLESSTTPDGKKEIVLYERDGVFSIRVGGMELMSSRAHGSEEDMATLVLAEVGTSRPRVLVGGLGMGFTLRAVLDAMPAAGRTTVAELLPEVVRWNREHLAHLARSPLDDPRVTMVEDDVGRVMASRPASFDAIVLDVDNGPAALTDRRNARLYREKGLALVRRSLRAGGVLGVWSASPDRTFERALRRAGFLARTETARARRGAKGPKHTIFIATPDPRAV